MIEPRITIVFFYKGAEVCRDKTLIPNNLSGREFLWKAIADKDYSLVNFPENWSKANLEPTLDISSYVEVPSFPYKTVFLIVAVVTAALLWSM